MTEEDDVSSASMERQVKRIVVLVIGWSLIAFGIVGLFLPVLQGVLFIMLGLLVLSRESHAAHRWLQHGRQRFPHVDSKLKEWGKWWRQRFGRERPEDNPSED